MKAKYWFEIYKDKKKEFRWRMVAPNGKIVADSAESYTRKESLLKTLLKIVIRFTGLRQIVDKTGGVTYSASRK